MKRAIPSNKLSKEDSALLADAPALRVIPLAKGFGLVVEVVSDDDETTVKREYLTFECADAANSFCSLVRGGLN